MTNEKDWIEVDRKDRTPRQLLTSLHEYMQTDGPTMTGGEFADLALFTLVDAGFRVFRPDDCLMTMECAHCVTASIPLDHHLEPFWLVPVEETKETV